MTGVTPAIRRDNGIAPVLQDQPDSTAMGPAEAFLIQAFDDALAQQARCQALEQRYSSSQATDYLGCKIYHLQAPHKRALPYEKDCPNLYHLSDLQAHCQGLRL